jgi:hypothetical protein
MFRKLSLLELTSLKWTKNHKTDEIPESPVTDITNRFNSLSYWVSTQIVSMDSQKIRVKLVKKFWKVAKCLRELGNFHSLMAIVAGLIRGPVQRLKKTLEAVNSHRGSSSIQNELVSLCEAKSRFASLRAALTAYPGPCIPYLGLILSDLVIIDEGNPDRVENLINWGKCVMIHSKASQVIKVLKDYPHTEVVPEIRSVLTDFKHMDDDTLYDTADYMENRRRSRTQSSPSAPETLIEFSKSMGAIEGGRSASQSPRKQSPRTHLISRPSQPNLLTSAKSASTPSSSSIIARGRAQSSGNMGLQKPLTAKSEPLSHRLASTSSPISLPSSSRMEVVHETNEAKMKGRKLSHARLFSSTH